MELQHGLPLYAQQFRALFYKNMLLSLRHKRATALHLASSLIFMFLILGVDQAVQARSRYTTTFKNLLTPLEQEVLPISSCEASLFLRRPCYDFVWSGNSSMNVSSVVSAMMKNNPGRPIPFSKVLGFETSKDVNVWLLENPAVCPVAIHFTEKSSTVISFGLQTNSTPIGLRGKYEDSVIKYQSPMQAAAEREIARHFIGDSMFSWNAKFAEFAHPARQTKSAVAITGPTFLLAATMFSFVIQMSNLVLEKELKLRQTMTVMGLIDSVYWATWLAWEISLALFSSTLLVLSGMMFRFNVFLVNNFGVLFSMFFLFNLNMIGFAFFLSAFLSKSSSANNAGFLIFITGFLTQLITTFGFPYEYSFAKLYQVTWSFFPPNLFAEGLNILARMAISSPHGITWSTLDACASGAHICSMTLVEFEKTLQLQGRVFKWLLSTFFLWFLLAIYLDNVIPDTNGVRKPFLYFLDPSYWTGITVKGGRYCGCTVSVPLLPQSCIAKDEDVAAEEEIVKRNQAIDSQDPNIAVQVRGLVKTFPSSLVCFKCKAGLPHHAVKGAWINIEKDKLFCLLGPNGAGKTTTINCLTGILPATAGDALVYGGSIRSSTEMSRIRSYMGVCPQFDILWDALTAIEHLQLFASIKGVKSEKISDVIKELLSKVRLSKAGNVRAGNFSGGMKRRLSVAIALIGDPKILYLDEPTTGMDPVSRRYVWDIIQDAKAGRAIVLTTHSMEEADVLADRIAIMAKGKLQCIGTSIHLKSKFGTGYMLNISVQDGLSNGFEITEDVDLKKAAVKKTFEETFSVKPYEEGRSFVSFVISRAKESKLSSFFKTLESGRKELGISDMQLSLTTLDEVFLNISKQAELETAAVEGRVEVVSLSDNLKIEVPIGAEFVTVPGTISEENPLGLMIEVTWQQDDRGCLCIYNISEMKQITQRY